MIGMARKDLIDMIAASDEFVLIADSDLPEGETLRTDKTVSRYVLARVYDLFRKYNVEPLMRRTIDRTFDWSGKGSLVEALAKGRASPIDDIAVNAAYGSVWGYCSSLIRNYSFSIETEHADEGAEGTTRVLWRRAWDE
jgi:hypothetical protein